MRLTSNIDYIIGTRISRERVLHLLFLHKEYSLQRTEPAKWEELLAGCRAPCTMVSYSDYKPPAVYVILEPTYYNFVSIPSITACADEMYRLLKVFNKHHMIKRSQY